MHATSIRFIHSDPGPDLSDDSLDFRTISVDDFFAVRDYFLQFVPLELANAILDAAMYWPSITTERTELLVASAGFVNKKNVAAYYLITPPIPQVVQDAVVLPMRVRMVKFTLKSCDQGFGGSFKIRGTYDKSPTWLEASILRDADPTKIDSLLRLGAVPSTQLDKASQDIEVRNPIDGETRRWHVQSNINASPEVRRHEVVWTSGDVCDEEAENDAKANGRGIGRGFISASSSGDRVGVVARARSSLWQNHVFGAQIDIFYST